ncbi:MAG: VWA domain-containing protein [Myxococcota bacterium]
MIEFGAPWVLWLAAPLLSVWAMLWLLREVRGGHRAAVLFSSLTELPVPASRGLGLLRLAVRAMRVGCLGLVLVAMARPQVELSSSKVFSEGIDIMLAVDTSGSMKALDLDADRPLRERRTRLEVVKAVVDRFVQRRPADQLGLVVFGQWAFTQCPLTLDHDVLAEFIADLEIGIAGRSTAIGDALGIAIKRLRDSKAKSRVLILLTDGQNNAGQLDPQKAAEIAATYGIRIYTIGAGTRGEAPVIDSGFLGPRVSMIEATIDDEALTQIAETTGGTYFRAEDVEALAQVYEQIDAMEKTNIEKDELTEYEDRYEGYVAAALVLLLLELLLLATRLRALP